MEKTRNEDLGRLSIEEFKQAEKLPFCVVLDDIRSLHNIGSVFRTADAFRVEHLYLCGITARPPHREIQKTALGATESIDWSYFPSCSDCILNLKQKGYLICALEQALESISLSEFQPPKGAKIALILGNEVEGVNTEVMNLCDYALEIPQYGTKHSLNVSVSGGIGIWEIWKKINTNFN
ncbi:MAG: RNA methyltransferase [Bacteroidales bacterium]